MFSQLCYTGCQYTFNGKKIKCAKQNNSNKRIFNTKYFCSCFSKEIKKIDKFNLNKIKII